MRRLDMRQGRRDHARLPAGQAGRAGTIHIDIAGAPHAGTGDKMLAFKIKAMVGALALCALQSGALAQDVKLGAVFPMSGPNATYGDLFSSGANLAVEHINADGKLKGKMSVIYEDSQALPQRGVIGMNKLVNVDKVPYVLSAFTGVSKAVSTVAQRTKTVAVNAGGVGPDLAELGEYFWNAIPLVNHEVRALVPYLVQQNLKKVALIYVDDPFGQAIVKELDGALGKAGGSLVGKLSVPPTAQQFGGIAAKVREMKPDAVYIASYGAQQFQIAKQLRDNGVTQQLASYSAFSVPEIQTLPEAKGTLYTELLVDMSAKDALTQRFVQDFKKKHGKEPTAYVASYYNATKLYGDLALALQAEGKPITGTNLLEARKKINTFDFVGGKVTFLPNGTVMAPMQIKQVDGTPSGKQVQVVKAN
jgi:ABC-type branched-subunit amino acid transport system substrate-binding protein